MTAGFGVVIALAIIQGFTEFLPISSSGHLVIVESLFKMRGLSIGSNILFDTVVHLGTLAAVIIFYRRKVLLLCRALLSVISSGAAGFKTYRAEIAYIGCIILGTIPAGIVGVLLNSWIERTFNSPELASLFLVVTGLILLASRFSGASRDLSWRTALVIGIVQAVAILPGISRSGSTITAGLILGLGYAQAAEFSFLLSVPAILGATVLELAKNPALLAGGSALPLLVGAVGALVSGLFALKLIIGILNRGVFHRFAYYLIPAGIAAFLCFRFWFAGLH